MIEETVRVDKWGMEEPFEKTLKRFKRQVEDELIFEDVKRHEFYRKPSRVRREHRKINDNSI
jgi:ribosomal protein S21